MPPKSQMSTPNLKIEPLTQPTEHRYQTEIEQMMFVFGEVSEPLDATVQLIEDIVQHQISELIQQTTQHVLTKRNSRIITAEDIVFLIRRNPAKVRRLRSYLSWKDVRRNTSEKDGGSAVDPEDLLESGASPVITTDKSMKVKRAKIHFSWDPLSSFNAMVDDYSADEDDDDNDDEQDLDDEQDQAHQAHIQRLRTEDEVTKAMTLEEYKRWTECRGASFTYKKAKKFREWCGLTGTYESKSNTEIIDILGFLSYDMVGNLTETALRIKQEWDLSKRKKTSTSSGAVTPAVADNEHNNNMNMDEDEEDDDDYLASLAGMNSLFGKSVSERTPLLPSHVHAAYRESQMERSHVLRNFRGGVVRSSEVFI
ncbi:hypothetical protein SmJEL517_g01176 [Synchytrium microbalum]|uniref:Uncharacterized protein n=1 Tax=Synchytrium microbalum TaxID=1806994 RepID=A0A507CGH0_9FUNG|nr:uncharacterized protein SmJEL517_g01176 [Synchytrium microbalum]TPX36603.1 hypothetical protein SmJEL517_g01176 [Synchytrium microbalum]